MKIGDIVTFCYGSSNSSVIILSIGEDVFNGVKYMVYNLGERHVLYVKTGVVVSTTVDLKGHLITEMKEIQGGDYYMKVNSKYALPVM